MDRASTRLRPASPRGPGLIALAAVALCSCGKPAPVPATEPPISLGKAQPTDLRTRIDGLIQPYIDRGDLVGVALAVIEGGEAIFMGYGQVAADDPRRPSPDTIFELGQVTEVLTCLILADQVVRDKLSLLTPVEDLLPTSVTLRGRELKSITLGQLASHHSGLAPHPGNIAPATSENPYATYTIDQLYRDLTSAKLLDPPGTRYRYSAFGAGLLGHALARFAELSYAELIRRGISIPIGMTATRVDLDAGHLSRLALGHDRLRRMVSAWDFPALPGAGGLRSSTRDMAAFLRAHIALQPESLAAAIRLAETSRHGLPDATGEIALGWLIRSDGLRWRSGQTGGYTSFVAFDRGRQDGAVLLANTAMPSGDELGFAVIATLRNRGAKAARPR